LGTLILYFDLTIAWAKTQREIDGVVGGDGAKLVFMSMFLGPATSVLLAAVGLSVNYIGRAFVLPSSQIDLGKPVEKRHHSSQNDNPYRPPGIS
jgi:hypothetical protein